MTAGRWANVPAGGTRGRLRPMQGRLCKMCMLHRFLRFVVDLCRFFFVGYCWSLVGFGVAFIGSYTDLEGPVSSELSASNK